MLAIYIPLKNASQCSYVIANFGLPLSPFRVSGASYDNLDADEPQTFLMYVLARFKISRTSNGMSTEARDVSASTSCRNAYVCKRILIFSTNSLYS